MSVIENISNNSVNQEELLKKDVSKTNNQVWNKFELLGFRIAFMFFVLISFPWLGFFKKLFEFDGLIPHFKQLLDLLSYLPTIVPTEPYGLSAFANIFIFLFLSILGAFIWAFIEKDKKQYNTWNYLLRVLLRYKIGLSLFAFGLYLLFQQHLPYPSLSNLHTNYGDLFSWKVYFQTTAINPEYQSFLGSVVIISAILIVYRRTTGIGAGIALGFFSNVYVVNLLYDVGDLYYLTFLMLALTYLIINQVPKLIDLFNNKWVVGASFYPVKNSVVLKKTRSVGLLVYLVLVFVLLASIISIGNQSYKYPSTAGIPGTEGYYEVTEFIFNKDTIPYSLTNPNRWQNVIFEKWVTMSVRVNKPIKVDVSDGDEISEEDFDRSYEIAGAGGRHYYHYSYNSENHKLLLFNKNKNHLEDKWDINFTKLNDSTIVLVGSNHKNDNIQARLERKEKKYFMYEGRRSDIKL